MKKQFYDNSRIALYMDVYNHQIFSKRILSNIIKKIVGEFAFMINMGILFYQAINKFLTLIVFISLLVANILWSTEIPQNICSYRIIVFVAHLCIFDILETN